MIKESVTSFMYKVCALQSNCFFFSKSEINQVFDNRLQFTYK